MYKETKGEKRSEKLEKAATRFENIENGRGFAKVDRNKFGRNNQSVNFVSGYSSSVLHLL